MNGESSLWMKLGQLMSNGWKYTVGIGGAEVIATDEELGAQEIFVVECTGNGSGDG
jgi:hypothetical protein